MPINSSIWGISEQWSTVKFGIYEEETSFKFSNFPKIAGTTTNESGYGTSRLGCGVYYDIINTENEEMDTSISPWNINSNSMLFNPTLCLVHVENAENVIINPIKIFTGSKQKMIISRNAINLNQYINDKVVIIGSGDNKLEKHYSLSPYNYDAGFRFGVSKEVFMNNPQMEFTDSLTDTEAKRLSKNISYITDFNYREILLYPFILANNDITDTANVIRYNINSYFNSGKNVNPYIRAIGFTPYIKVNGEFEEAENFIQLINCNKINVSEYIIKSNYEDVNYNVDEYKDYYNYSFSTCIYHKDNNRWYDLIRPSYSEKQYKQYCMFVNTNSKFKYYANKHINDFYIMPYSDTLSKDEVLKEIAYLGFWFTPSAQGITDANNNKFGESDNLYLPEFDSSNTTTGNYKYGQDAKSLSNFNYTNNIVESGDLTKLGDKGDLTTVINSNKAGGNRKIFFLNNLKFDLFLQYLNGNIPKDADFKGSNPADYIYSIIYYPFRPKNGIWNDEPIGIGPVETNITAPSSYQLYGLPYVYKTDIKSQFNDFRDYPPYTTITLQTICGNIELDPYLYMNHTVQVHFYLDIVTGSCIIYIFRDNLVMQQIQGRFGSNVVITAANMGQYQNAIAALETSQQQAQNSQVSNYINAASGIAMTTVGFATGNPLLVIGGAATFGNAAISDMNSGKQREQINYNIDHLHPAIQQIGSTPTVNNLLLQYNPKLLIKRCKMSDNFNADSYGKTVGYACNVNGKVKDFTGFTVAYNIDLDNINCSVKEKGMIKGLFNSGVYL